jgi:hypothetical protein
MWCSFSDYGVRNLRLQNVLAAVEGLPTLSVSKYGRNLVHGRRPAPAQAFLQATFCAGGRAGGHAGLSAVVVVFTASDVGDPLSGKHKFSTFWFSTSFVDVGYIGVGGRA